MEDEKKTLTINKSTWKRLTQEKLDGDYNSLDQLLNVLLKNWTQE